jgi:oxygen-independent coproporphyrinogen-3 oxidase
MTRIFSTADKSENVEFSFEGYPNNTTQEHSFTLGKLDSNRVCYGV